MERKHLAHMVTHTITAMAKTLLPVFFVFMTYAPFAQSQSSQGKAAELKIALTVDFEITGTGSAPQWEKTSWLPITQRQNTGGKYATSIKVLYSTTGIYCLFRCEDRKITASLKEDFTDLYKEDVIEIFFWPDESVPVYFEYELSPLNYELVIVVPNYNGNFFGWLPWHYEGERVTRHETTIKEQVGDASWMAEVFIPFALLKPLIQGPPEKGARWRANFYRIDYDGGRSSWSWQLTQKTFHDYKNFGTIVFD